MKFPFAMLEVSDSLILAMKEQFYPITKAIYVLLGRIADGPYIACAMGMLGMALLTVSLMPAGKFLGKRMGSCLGCETKATSRRLQDLGGLGRIEKVMRHLQGGPFIVPPVGKL